MTVEDVGDGGVRCRASDLGRRHGRRVWCRVVQVAGEEVAVTRRAARHGACAVRCRRGASGVRVTGVCGRA